MQLRPGIPAPTCTITARNVRLNPDAPPAPRLLHPCLTTPQSPPDRLSEAVAARLRGYAQVAAVRRAELRSLTDGEAARIAEELFQIIPLLGEEPDRGSGLVKQQRLLSRARR